MDQSQGFSRHGGIAPWLRFSSRADNEAPLRADAKRKTVDGRLSTVNAGPERAALQRPLQILKCQRR
jgi:hypothetical protein